MYFAMYEEGGPGGTLSCLDDEEKNSDTIAGETEFEVHDRILALRAKNLLSFTGPIVICQVVSRLGISWDHETVMDALCECGNTYGDHSTLDFCPTPKATGRGWTKSKFKAVV